MKSVLASSNNSAEKKKRGRPKRSAETVSVPMKPESPKASPHKKEVASQPRKTGRFTRRSQAEVGVCYVLTVLPCIAWESVGFLLDPETNGGLFPSVGARPKSRP